MSYKKDRISSLSNKFQFSEQNEHSTKAVNLIALHLLKNSLFIIQNWRITCYVSHLSEHNGFDWKFNSKRIIFRWKLFIGKKNKI